MSAELFVLTVVGSPFLIYIVARLIFAAFFYTKSQYEKRRHHGS